MGEHTIKISADNADLIAALQENTKAVTRLANVMLDQKNGSTATAEAEAKTEPKKVEAPKEPAKPKIAREDVVKALKDFSALEGKEAAIAILKDLGADSVSDLDPDKYEQAIAKTKGEG